MKLIVLDRDGVINFDSPDYIKHPDEWQPIPGSLEAVGRLSAAGYTIAVATNQSGIGRGYYTHKILQAIHDKMEQALAAYSGVINKIFYCPHLPDVNCECRKPQPGLLHQIASHFQCDLSRVPMVGDRLSDVETARAAGAVPILVRTGFVDDDEVHTDKLEDVLIFENLASVVDHILNPGCLRP